MLRLGSSAVDYPRGFRGLQSVALRSSSVISLSQIPTVLIIPSLDGQAHQRGKNHVEAIVAVSAIAR